ncbi:MAG: gliding motility-associated C-terminal domain-containing protein [Bacteroidia bacterium]|nr:gliding motility-associated C-terminal domain-containing protein [Bacteroidia bacterium]
MTLVFVLSSFVVINAQNTVTTLPLANNSLCACNQVLVSYSATGNYNAGNVFTVQLSDAGGNFVGATTIGTLNSQANNGTINCTIPCNTPYGTGYRIRIISSNPAAGGPNNGSNITIAPSPSVSISFSTANCVDTLTANPSGGGGGGPVQNGTKYYITDQQPWGVTSNVDEMNAVFGIGNWIQASFSNPAPATIFAPGTQLVFIDGGDMNGIACDNYITANIALIENWVNQGGQLFLNAAPNNGIQQNWGFGGVINNYPNYVPVLGNNVPGALVTNMLHPINTGPFQPTDPNGVYTGNYYAHSNIINGGTTLMHSAADPNIAVLTEKNWGAGKVLFGGMTSTFFHNTVPPLQNADASNLRKNMLAYLSGPVMPPAPTYTYLWSNGAITKQIVPTVTGVYTVTVTSNLGCTATATYSYVAPPPVNVQIDSSGVLCSGNSVTLNAGAGFATYLWDDNSTNQTRVVNTPGVYYVTVTNAQNCIGSDTIVINQDTTVKADFSVSVHLGCKRDTIFLTNNSTGGTQWFWLFGDGAYSTSQHPVPYVYANQGIYTIRLIVTNPPCADTMLVTINTNHPISSNFVLPKDTMCITSPIAPTLTNNPDPTWIHTWIWGDGTPNGTGITPFHMYSMPGTYTIKHIVVDTLGCVDSTSKTVTVDFPAYAEFSIFDNQVCLGEKILLNIDTISTSTYSYYWNFGDGFTLYDIPNPMHVYDNPGNYVITLVGKSKFCDSTVITKSVEILPFPQINLGRDTAICPGLTGAIVLADVNNPAAIYQWSTGEVSNSITVSTPGTYWARTQGECVAVDSITIFRDCYLNVPNAFSPDGDGLNDYFLPRDLLSAGLTLFKMDIYNRWGELLFSTTSLDGKGWDGKYNGTPQPIGTYIYTINAEFKNGVKKTYKGNVTLIR